MAEVGVYDPGLTSPTRRQADHGYAAGSKITVVRGGNQTTTLRALTATLPSRRR